LLLSEAEVAKYCLYFTAALGGDASDLVTTFAERANLGGGGRERLLVNEMAPRVDKFGHWTGRKMGHVNRLHPLGSLNGG
jgi:hypothetical protein